MWSFNLGFKLTEWIDNSQFLIKRGKTVRNMFGNEKKKSSVVSGHIKWKMVIRQPSGDTGNWINLCSGLDVYI